MLVEFRPTNGEPPQCLLGRHSRLHSCVYSTLAGFVEPKPLQSPSIAPKRKPRITIDALDEARWFTAEDIPALGEWEDERAVRRLPRKDSIARFLIESSPAECNR